MKKNIVKGKSFLGAAIVAGLLVSGCGDSENFVFTNTVPIAVPTPPVPSPPVAVNDNFPALGDATVTISAGNGVLTNDTVNGAEISAFDSTGSNGGTVVLNDDGSFSYTPVIGFVGAETFTYTLSNDDGTSTATVTMTSTGRGLFVNNLAGTTGNGSQTDPFDELTDAIAAASSGDTIFVFRGDGSSTGLNADVTLPEGVNLIGEGLGLILAQTVEPQGQAPVVEATITVSGDNTISGFSFEDPDQAILGSAVANVTISNNTFLNGQTPRNQVNLTDTSGAITITGNTFSLDNESDAVILDTAATGNCNFVLNNNAFVLPDATADSDECFLIEVEGDSVVTVQMNDNTFSGTASNFSHVGLTLTTRDTSQTTLTAEGNTATFVRRLFLTTSLGTSSLNTSLIDNTSDQSTDNDLDIRALGSSTQTVLIDNNQITDSAATAIAANARSMGTLNLAVNNSTFTGSTGLSVRDTEESGSVVISISESVLAGTGRAINVDELDDSSSLKIALRNSSFTTTAGTEAAYFETDNSAEFCGEITGNTFSGDLIFRDGGSGDYNVEQFGNATGDVLATLNTFTSGMIVVAGGTVVSVADGACLIP